LGIPQIYGWSGSAWVKDNLTSREIPKTGTQLLTNGLSVSFSNNTGKPWDTQFISGEHFNFVHGATTIKDNLQTMLLKARSYICESHVIEAYAVTVPAVAPYEIAIPEASLPNFRDLDSTDFITEVFESAIQYTYYNPAASTYTVVATTDILTVGANIATGTAIAIYSTSLITNCPTPLQPNNLYYAININSTTIKLATSYANAIAGTAIDITSTGLGAQSYRIIIPTTTTFRVGGQGIFKFAAADAGKNLTLTYTYTKFTV